VRPVAIAGVMPTTTVDARSAAIFQELVTSPLFIDYRDSHLALEDRRIRLTVAQSEIRRTARRLVDRNRKMLGMRKVAGTLVRITGDLLQPLFGKVGTSLASRAADLIDQARSNDRNIVIYDLSPVFGTALSDMLSTGRFPKMAQHGEE
jgi:hypothetical protein